MAQNRTRILVALVLFILTVFPASAGSLFVTTLATDANAVLSGSATTTNSLPPSGDWVQLTPAGAGTAGGVVYNQAFSIDPTRPVSGFFDYYVGGGTGADGMSFFLLDATAPGWSAGVVTPGGVGSSLGYAQRQSGSATTPGVTGGYVGIGLDEWGWFANNWEGHDGVADGGYPRYRKNWISVRGCAGGAGNCTTAASTTGYSFLTGHDSGVDLDSASLPGQFWRVTFSFAPVSGTSDLLFSMGLQRRDNVDDNSRSILSVYDNQLISPGGALPNQIAIGWGASTGSITNTHAIGNFGIDFTPPDGPDDPETPEPGTYLMMAGGLLVLWRWRARSA